MEKKIDVLCEKDKSCVTLKIHDKETATNFLSMLKNETECAFDSYEDMKTIETYVTTYNALNKAISEAFGNEKEKSETPFI